MINLWKTEFEFHNASTGGTHYFLDDREMIKEDSLLKTHDLHFKFQKCLDGVVYSYIKDTNDIYDKSVLTGDGYSINNMYNKYNIIDKYVKNLHHVDIAIGGEDNENIDLSIQHHSIDDIQVKPSHLILIFGQDDKVKNDIYVVTDKYFLEKTDLLSTREKSDKAKFYVKLGTWKETQFFLMNESIIFPTTNEEKIFIAHHSYILKSKLNYDINNPDSAGLLFTNYDVARHLQDNQTIYDTISIPYENNFIILLIEVTDNETFTLNLPSGYVYEGDILWGDGDNTDMTSVTGSVSHTYTHGGNYNIIMTEKFEALDFQNDQHIIEVISWGKPEITNLRYVDFSNSSLKKITNESGRLIHVETFENRFKYINIETIPEMLFSGNTISTSFENTFQGCTLITEVPEKLFRDNIANTTFKSTFKDCSNLSLLHNTLFSSNVLVTTFESIFENCNIENIPYYLFHNNAEVTTFKNTFKSNRVSFKFDIQNNEIFKNNTLVTTFESTFENNRIVNLNYKIFRYNTEVTTFKNTFKMNKISNIIVAIFEKNTLATTFESTFENNNLSEIDTYFYYNIEVLSFKATFKTNRICSIPSDLFETNTLVTTFESTFENNLIEQIQANYSLLQQKSQSRFNVTYTTYKDDLFKNNEEVITFKKTFYKNRISILYLPFYYNYNATNFESTFEQNLITSIDRNIFIRNLGVTKFNYTFKNNKLTNINDIFYENDKVTEFISTFENNDIKTINENIFKYNTEVTTFNSTFKNNKIIELPNIFDFNTKVRTFKSTFEDNSNLKLILETIFHGNANVINFEKTFKNCVKLKTKLYKELINISGGGELDPGLLINITPVNKYRYYYKTEDLFINNNQVINFISCFENCGYLNGKVEELWNRTLPPLIIGKSCFNNCTGLYNYNKIPLNWGGEN